MLYQYFVILFFFGQGKKNLLKMQLCDMNNIVKIYGPNTQTQVFKEKALLPNATKFWRFWAQNEWQGHIGHTVLGFFLIIFF